MTVRAVLLLALGIQGTTVHAQQSPATTDTTGARGAREQIRLALRALGGEDQVRAIATIEIQGTGAEFRAAEIQGWKPGSRMRSEHRETLVADFPNQRVSHEYRTGRHDGSTRWRRFMYAGEERAWIEFTNRIADRRPHPRAAEDRRELFRRIPHHLPLEAWDHPEGLRMLPDTTTGAAPARRVVRDPGAQGNHSPPARGGERHCSRP
ncbi:MAG: hypothetical protein ACREOF_00400 [Gemmatimonadales bacterium]